MADLHSTFYFVVNLQHLSCFFDVRLCMINESVELRRYDTLFSKISFLPLSFCRPARHYWWLITWWENYSNLEQLMKGSYLILFRGTQPQNMAARSGAWFGCFLFYFFLYFFGNFWFQNFQHGWVFLVQFFSLSYWFSQKLIVEVTFFILKKCKVGYFTQYFFL